MGNYFPPVRVLLFGMIARLLSASTIRIWPLKAMQLQLHLGISPCNITLASFARPKLVPIVGSPDQAPSTHPPCGTMSENGA